MLRWWKRKRSKVKREKEDVSRLVLLHGLQSWSQTVEQKTQAWQGAYDFMGLDVKLGIDESAGRKRWAFEGEDADTAKLFMDTVCEQFPIGSWEQEQAMIERYMDKYKKN